MRILLFSDTYRPTVNGVARALGLLVEHAGREGHEVGLVTPEVSAEPAPGVSFHLQIPGLPLPMYPELKAARPWLGHRARRRLEDFRPDVVHVATEAVVGWMGHRWARRRQLPLLTSYCTNFPEYMAGYGLGWADGLVWRHLRRFHGVADLTVCPSEWTRLELRARGFADPLEIWSRGVDAELFHPSKRSEAVREAMAPGAEVILVYVGRIAPEKRTDLLVEAFARLREATLRSVALVLVGDGPALEGLRRQDHPGVHFTGYRTGESLAAHYASADLFAFASDTETFGQVVTEAQASGLAAVAPARGGVVDTVVPGVTGALFPPGDVDQFARRLRELVEDDGARREMGLEARRRAEARSWSGVFRSLFRHYAGLSGGRDDFVTAPSSSHVGIPATLDARDPDSGG